MGRAEHCLDLIAGVGAKPIRGFRLLAGRFFFLISFFYHRIINFGVQTGEISFLILVLFSRESIAVIHHIDRLPTFPMTGKGGSHAENINNSNNFGTLEEKYFSY